MIADENACLIKIYKLCSKIGDPATTATMKILVLSDEDKVIEERIDYYDGLADVYRLEKSNLAKQYRKVAKLIREFKNKSKKT